MKNDDRGISQTTVSDFYHASLEMVTSRTVIPNIIDIYGNSKRPKKIKHKSGGLCRGFALMYLVLALSGCEEKYFNTLDKLAKDMTDIRKWIFTEKDKQSNDLSKEIKERIQEYLFFLYTIQQLHDMPTRLSSTRVNAIAWDIARKCFAIFFILSLVTLIPSIMFELPCLINAMHKQFNIKVHTLKKISLTLIGVFALSVILDISFVVVTHFLEKHECLLDKVVANAEEKNDLEYYLITIPCSLCPPSSGHAMAAKYDSSQEKKWTLIDSNDGGKDDDKDKSFFTSKEEMIKRIEKTYSTKERYISVTPYTLSETAKNNISREQNATDDESVTQCLHRFFGMGNFQRSPVEEL